MPIFGQRARENSKDPDQTAQIKFQCLQTIMQSILVYQVKWTGQNPTSMEWIPKN